MSGRGKGRRKEEGLRCGLRREPWAGAFGRLGLSESSAAFSPCFALPLVFSLSNRVKYRYLLRGGVMLLYLTLVITPRLRGVPACRSGF